MKKITLLVAGLLLSGTLAHASETTVFSDDNRTYIAYGDYLTAEPVIFNERGIEFMVFLTGELDFNTTPNTTGGYYYRTNGRTVTAASGTRQSVYANTGVRVEHDYQGRVRRVGNVYISYDAFGRVRRIGSVYMNYNSFALNRIGGMRFVYNRYGQVVRTYGMVKPSVRGYAYQPYTPANGYTYSNNNSYGNSNEDFYYYRKDGTKAKMTEADIEEIKLEELKK